MAFMAKRGVRSVKLPQVQAHQSAPPPASPRLGELLFWLGGASFFRGQRPNSFVCYLFRETPIVVPGVHTDRQLAKRYARQVALQLLMQRSSSFGDLAVPPPLWGEHLQATRLNTAKQSQLRLRQQHRMHWIGDRRRA
jgi:hypothetical protein